LSAAVKVTVGNRTIIDIQQLCNLICSLKSLRTLSLVSELLDAQGVCLITQTLETNSAITSLDLSENPSILQGDTDGYDSNGGLTHKTTAVGLKAIAQMLRVNRTLRHLRLAHCRLLDDDHGQAGEQHSVVCEGIYEIGYALRKVNWAIQEVDLCNNNFINSPGLALMLRTASTAKLPVPVHSHCKALIVWICIGSDSLPHNVCSTSSAKSREVEEACPLEILRKLGSDAAQSVLMRIFSFAATLRVSPRVFTGIARGFP
jgi:hypothetical protein